MNQNNLAGGKMCINIWMFWVPLF